VLSGRGLCDELVTHPEASYRLWRVVVCDLETRGMRGSWPGVGPQRHKNKNSEREDSALTNLSECVVVFPTDEGRQ